MPFRRSRLIAAGLAALAGSAHAADPPTPPPVADPVALPRPAYARAEPLPIDLPTVLRLVNENSPTIGFAQARLREAQARFDRARVLWLPDLAGGLNYFRNDGRTQNQNGQIFDVSRSNLAAGGGLSLRVETADAVYDRLVARRLTAAERSAARQTVVATQLDAALAYLDLLDVFGRLAINADTLDRAETMLRFAENAQAAQLSKTAGDVNRARAEVYYRRQERIDLQARAASASARLAQLLLLPPAIDLHPADPAVVPVVLVDGSYTLDDLLAVAIANRPDLASYRALVSAAAERVRKARLGPLLPRLQVDEAVNTFGGGTGAFVGNFGSQNVITAGVTWRLASLGLGTAAQIREQRAALDQARYRLTEVQARALADVAEAAKVSAAKYDSLDVAQKAVAEATELYRKLRETSFNMVGPRAQYDALEPLTAIQQLNQARQQYLSAVIDFNRAQFRLFAALGYPVDQNRATARTATPP